MKTGKEQFEQFCTEFKHSHEILDRLMPEKALSLFAIEFAKRYATEAIKEHLTRAAERVQHVPGFSVNPELLGLIDKQSIIDTEIILP